jgi:hypothetical protein
MLYNNIKKVLREIPLFPSQGTESILNIDCARRIVHYINSVDLSNPTTTYQDAQCGSGLPMLVLADQLMVSLAEAIPDEQERLVHIFSKQLFLSDINPIQVRIARANLLKAIGNREFPINIKQQDCFTNSQQTNYIIGSIDFQTTNRFVPYYRELTDHIVIVTRSNKNRYADNAITEIQEYEYLGANMNSTPICIMHFTRQTDKTSVQFNDKQRTITVNNPKFLPGIDLLGFEYASEIIKQQFRGYTATYGTIGRPLANKNPGTIPIIFGIGKAGDAFRDVIGVDSKIITEKEGLGKNKLVIIKNGNRGNKNCIKFAGPEYGVGETVLWVEVTDEVEFKKFAKVWDEESYDKLIRVIRETSPANGKSFWDHIPNIKYLKEVKRIYERYYKSNNN